MNDEILDRINKHLEDMTIRLDRIDVLADRLRGIELAAIAVRAAMNASDDTDDWMEALYDLLAALK